MPYFLFFQDLCLLLLYLQGLFAHPKFPLLISSPASHPLLTLAHRSKSFLLASNPGLERGSRLKEICKCLKLGCSFPPSLSPLKPRSSIGATRVSDKLASARQILGTTGIWGAAFNCDLASQPMKTGKPEKRLSVASGSGLGEGTRSARPSHAGINSDLSQTSRSPAARSGQAGEPAPRAAALPPRPAPPNPGPPASGLAPPCFNYVIDFRLGRFGTPLLPTV